MIKTLAWHLRVLSQKPPFLLKDHSGLTLFCFEMGMFLWRSLKWSGGGGQVRDGQGSPGVFQLEPPS